MLEISLTRLKAQIDRAMTIGIASSAPEALFRYAHLTRGYKKGRVQSSRHTDPPDPEQRTYKPRSTESGKLYASAEDYCQPEVEKSTSLSIWMNKWQSSKQAAAAGILTYCLCPEAFGR